MLLCGLHVFHLLFSFHHFLLGHFCLFTSGFTHSGFVLLAVIGVVFPDQLEHFFRLVGSDGRFDFFAFEGDFNEPFFVFPLIVEGEPVVEVLAADAPSMSDTIGVDECHCLDLIEEYGFGGG